MVIFGLFRLTQKSLLMVAKKWNENPKADNKIAIISKSNRSNGKCNFALTQYQHLLVECNRSIRYYIGVFRKEILINVDSRTITGIAKKK